MVDLSKLQTCDLERLHTMALDSMNIMESSTGLSFIQLAGNDVDYFHLFRITTMTFVELNKRLLKAG